MGSKGKTVAIHEVKSAEQYSSSSQYEAISKSLDEICAKVLSEPNPSYFQIVFTEDEWAATDNLLTLTWATPVNNIHKYINFLIFKTDATIWATLSLTF